MWSEWKHFIRSYIQQQERAMLVEIEPLHVTKEWVEKHCRCIKQEKTRHLLCQESCPIHNSFIQFTYPGVKLAIERVTAELRWKLRWWEQQPKAA